MILPDGRDLRPGKVLCIGRNYVAHVIEMGGREGDQPVVFLKPSSALILRPLWRARLCARSTWAVRGRGGSAVRGEGVMGG